VPWPIDVNFLCFRPSPNRLWGKIRSVGEEIRFEDEVLSSTPFASDGNFHRDTTGTRLAPVSRMRIGAHALAALIVLVGSAGCASMPPVRLDATRTDLEMLAGQWDGEYTSPALGRRGSIEFKLVAGQNQASGDVLMIPQGSGTPYQPGSFEHPPNSPGNQPPWQLLTIRFVRASGGTISGMLDPYWDPDRNCEARTVFEGNLVERRIEGTFRTTFDCGAGQASGRWHVTRKSVSREGHHDGR
jgi:hypothetical protein